MAPLAKYRASLALFVASSFPIVILSLYVHEAFVVLFFSNVLFWSWRLKRISCAHCGHPLAPPIGASALIIFRSFLTAECTNCGRKLD
jgi:ribosomal protein S27E